MCTTCNLPIRKLNVPSIQISNVSSNWLFSVFRWMLYLLEIFLNSHPQYQCPLKICSKFFREVSYQKMTSAISRSSPTLFRATKKEISQVVLLQNIMYELKKMTCSSWHSKWGCIPPSSGQKKKRPRNGHLCVMAIHFPLF